MARPFPVFHCLPATLILLRAMWLGSVQASAPGVKGLSVASVIVIPRPFHNAVAERPDKGRQSSGAPNALIAPAYVGSDPGPQMRYEPTLIEDWDATIRVSVLALAQPSGIPASPRLMAARAMTQNL
jgi:hypothetical protein